ncbi:MAG: hypothetical protein V4615_08395 [Bacteroidota bacterium]
MEKKAENKPSEPEQKHEQQKVNKQLEEGKGEENTTSSGDKESAKNLSIEEEEERNRGLEKTHQSQHQPLPGENSDEAKGIADEESQDCEKDNTP